MSNHDQREAEQAILYVVQGSMTGAWIRGLLGAIIGGGAGWFAYFWLLDQGFDGLMIPGALVGAGFSTLSHRSAWSFGFACALMGLGLMLVCEWQSLVNFRNGSFFDFLANVQKLNTPNKIMLGGGTLVAFWLGKGR